VVAPSSGGRGGSALKPLIRILSLARMNRHGWTALACMIPLGMVGQFFQSSNGVIGPNLMQELGLTADGLGFLSGSLFIVSAAFQIPIGLLLDRFGARNIVTAMLLVAICGSLLFALSHSLAALTFARFMIGVGFAAMMVGGMVILSRWFPSALFASTVGLLFASSNAGTLIATLPLAAATDAWGWRSVFVALAILTGALTWLFYLVVRDGPQDHPIHTRSPELFTVAIARLWHGWKLPGVIAILPMIGIGYASVITVLGLWGGPFLYEVHGLDAVSRGQVLSIMAIAMIAGTLAYGPVDLWLNNRRGLVTTGAVAAIVPLCALAFWPDAPLRQITILLATFSFFGAYSVVVMAHGVALFPDELKGRGITTLNTALLTGAALTQISSGKLIGAIANGEEDSVTAPYTLLFLGLAAAIAVALVVYWRVPNTSSNEIQRPPGGDAADETLPSPIRTTGEPTPIPTM
jgi:MFS family permease